MHYSTGVLLSLPWIVPPVVTWFRLRNSRSLDDESAAVPSAAPLVSVVVPARNEAHNIARCVASILSSDYPYLELIVVNDDSTDDTAAVARDAAKSDSRFQLVENPLRPDDWFGKQWACATGARVAAGAILQFTDADTVHSRDLIPRSVNAMIRTGADLFTVAGRQELGGFWERIIQPQVFTMLSMRYGGTESVNESPRVIDKIANGQCIFVRRDAYDALGGHAVVRTSVAEDLMLAQRFFAAGRKVVVILGIEQLATRMYASLPEIIRGWRKNVFAGGLDAVPFGRVGRVLFPLFLPLPPLMGFLPPLLLLLGLLSPAAPALIVWAAISSALMLLWWIVVYTTIGESPLYALLYPLGALMLFYIIVTAVLRGRRVTWKGRTYVAR
jgi:chlorobactene glucosyltransferase